MTLADPLVRTCPKCAVTRSLRSFLSSGNGKKSGEYLPWCGPCRAPDRYKRYRRKQKMFVQEFDGIRYGKPYPRGLARLEERHEPMKQEVVERFNAFAVRAVADSIKRVSTTRTQDRRASGKHAFTYKDMVLLPFLVGVREEIRRMTVERRRVVYPMWMASTEAHEALRHHYRALSNNTKMKQYAGMDEYEPHPSLLALNNALDLPQREAGLDGASRAYLYEFLWEWCDRQRVSAGLSADYREHLHNNGSGAFFKYKPRTRNMADYYASKVPDVLLDEPGKPVVSVDDVWGRGAVAASTRERAWAERQPAEERVTTRVERVDCESLKSLVDIDTLGGFGGLELGLPSSPKGAHLRGRNAVPRLGRPPIEQTLARAYIDMRLVEEEMWARYPEHFAERGSADAARWA